MKLIYGYVVFLAILTAAILLMPMTSTNGIDNMPILYTAGAMFWIGLLGTVIMAICVNSYRKRNIKCKDEQVGLVHFFQNPEAKVADIVMIVSVIGFVITMAISANQIVQFILLAVSVLSFGLHCMLNGINYKCLKRKGDK